MSYTPPVYTDAGGSVTSGYTPPAYTDVGGDVAPVASACAYDSPGVTYNEAGRAYDNLTCPVIVVDPEYFERNLGESYVLLAELFFEGGRYTQRVASDWWYSRATDSIGAKEFASRILQEPNYDVELGCLVWGKKTTASFGSLEVADPAGDLDWMLRKHRDSICVLRLALPYQSYDSTRVVAVLLVDSVDMDGLVKRVNFRGIDTLLDRQFQPRVYGPTTDASTSSEALPAVDVPPPGNASGNASIEGESVPVVLGNVYQAEPVLVSVNQLAFQVADMPIVEISAVMSGGAVALPPDSSGEEWDYTYDDTSFQMTVTPAERVTVNASGIRALTAALFGSRFSGEWSSEGPDGWGVSGNSSDATVAAVPFVGARLQAGPVGEYGPYLSRALGLAEGDWCVVVVDVADVSAGYLVVDFGERREIRREGKHSVIGVVGPSGDLVIRGVGESDGLDVTVASVYAYGQASTGTETLVEAMRHATIARGALPDSTVVGVELIPNGSIPSSDYDFTQEWNNESDGYYVVTTGFDLGVNLNWEVGNGLEESYFRAIWPEVLEVGQRYRASLSWNIASFSGTFGDDFDLEVYFWPLSGDASKAITIGNASDSGSVSGSVFEIAGDFVPTVPGRFYVAVRASATSSVVLNTDDISLQRLDPTDDGATVDFDSLSDIDDGYQFGLVSEGNETVREVVQRILDSVAGWMYPSDEGRIRFGRLALPEGPSSFSINSTNMLSIPKFRPDLAPGLSDTVAAERNWSPYNDSELAGITYPNRPPFKAAYRAKRRGAYSGQLARQYTHAVGAEATPSLLSRGSDAQLEADRVTEIYTVPALGFWEIEVALSSALEAANLLIDEIVTLDDPLFGPDNGKKARVVGKGGKYRSNIVTLTVWGASNG